MTSDLKLLFWQTSKRSNFLDLTFDQTNGTYKPHRKPNDEPIYINRSSNHPPSIIHKLPHSVNQQINVLSYNKEAFDKAAQMYNNALKHSNFNTQLKHNPNMHTETHNRRQCNVTWYNPPYSKNIKTNITRDFLQLIDKHFPPNNKLHKLFNRHTIRVSYSCSENMETFIKRHNNTILKRHDNQEKPSYTKNTQLCNCRNPEQCPANQRPLQGKSNDHWQQQDEDIHRCNR